MIQNYSHFLKTGGAQEGSAHPDGGKEREQEEGGGAGENGGGDDLQIVNKDNTENYS